MHIIYNITYNNNNLFTIFITMTATMARTRCRFGSVHYIYSLSELKDKGVPTPRPRGSGSVAQ